MYIPVLSIVAIAFALYMIRRVRAEVRTTVADVNLKKKRVARKYVYRAAARLAAHMREVDTVINDMHGTPIYGPHLPYVQSDAEWAPLFSVGMGGTNTAEHFGGRTYMRVSPGGPRRHMGGTGSPALTVNADYPHPQNAWLGDPRHVGQGSMTWARDSHPEGDIGHGLGWDGDHGGGTVPTPNHGTGEPTS